MKPEYNDLYQVTVRTARDVGRLLRDGISVTKRADLIAKHDIKLEMDVRAQEFIYRRISRAFPDHEFLGEEDDAYHGGRQPTAVSSDFRWVVDPLDGTVNYFHSVPHYCTSIACQKRKIRNPKSEIRTDEWETIVGAVYDPSRDEMFSSQLGGPALLNDRVIRVSNRKRISEAFIAIGLFKSPKTIRYGKNNFIRFSRSARKVRIMGAAALDVVYIAGGRFDAYIEYGIKIWDIAAGLLILKNAGGAYRLRPTEFPYSYECIATNGKILKSQRFFTRR